MAPQVATPFDSTFWSFVVAVLALVVSLAPWIWKAVRPLKLQLEISDTVYPMHFPAGSVLGVFLSLANVGTRPLRVTRIIGRISVDEAPPAEIRCSVFFNRPEDIFSVTFLPVYLRPGESWGGYFTNFNHRVREYWTQARQNEEQIKAHPAPEFGPVLPDDPRAQAIENQRQLFYRTLSWRPGHYRITFVAEIDRLKIPVEATYMFVLHESEIEELRNAVSMVGGEPSIRNWPAVTMVQTQNKSR